MYFNMSSCNEPTFGLRQYSQTSKLSKKFKFQNPYNEMYTFLRVSAAGVMEEKSSIRPASTPKVVDITWAKNINEFAGPDVTDMLKIITKIRITVMGMNFPIMYRTQVYLACSLEHFTHLYSSELMAGAYPSIQLWQRSPFLFIWLQKKSLVSFDSLIKI